MMRMTLAASFVLAFPTIVCAQTHQMKVAKAHWVQKSPAIVNTPRCGFILMQDLFDRNNPNNVRSDWPAPPAQPGQY